MYEDQRVNSKLFDSIATITVFHPCPSQKKDARMVCRWDTEHCSMHGIVSETFDISWYFRWYL